jgi:anti-sigma-K factor RskA
MNGELTYNQMLELLPLYALGALDPDEMLAVDARLQGDSELLARLQALEEATSQLAYVAPDTALPGDTRRRLLARVREDQGAPAALAGARVTTRLSPPAEPGELDGAGGRRPNPGDAAARRSGWRAGLNRWALAAASAVLALLLVSAYAIQLRGQVAQLSAEAGTLRQANQQLQQQLQTHQEWLAYFSNADRSVALGGTVQAAGASGAFALAGDQGTFILRGLPPLPPDQTYQLWLVPRGGTPTSVGLARVGADGTAMVTVPVPTELRDFAIADVSVEPAGGSPQITKAAIVLRGTIS